MPSLAGFLFLPLLGGFFFLYFLNRTRFHYRKLDGHRLFFLAAVCGGVFLSISRIIILQLDGTLPGSMLRAPLKSFANFNFSGASIGALLLGLALPWIGNLRRRKRAGGSFVERWAFESNRYYALLRVAHAEDHLLDLLLQAQRDDITILLILDNGKAYVGKVLSAPPNLELPYVKLFPTISGYRTKEELDLELTTVYEKSMRFLAKAEEGSLTNDEEDQMEKLQIVLKRDKIVSASFFDEELYTSHQEARKKKRAATESRTHAKAQAAKRSRAGDSSTPRPAQGAG